MVDQTGREGANSQQTANKREVRDADGRAWLVRELKHEGYDRRSTSSLLFERHDVIRRVRNFPQDWMSLSDAELIALSNTR